MHKCFWSWIYKASDNTFYLNFLQGDSGSALLRADDGQQFGIVAWGFPGVADYPDVFVRISAYESWLKSVIV